MARKKSLDGGSDCSASLPRHVTSSHSNARAVQLATTGRHQARGSGELAGIGISADTLTLIQDISNSPDKLHHAGNVFPNPEADRFHPFPVHLSANSSASKQSKGHVGGLVGLIGRKIRGAAGGRRSNGETSFSSDAASESDDRRRQQRQRGEVDSASHKRSSFRRLAGGDKYADPDNIDVEERTSTAERGKGRHRWKLSKQRAVVSENVASMSEPETRESHVTGTRRLQVIVDEGPSSQMKNRTEKNRSAAQDDYSILLHVPAAQQEDHHRRHRSSSAQRGRLATSRQQLQQTTKDGGEQPAATTQRRRKGWKSTENVREQVIVKYPKYSTEALHTKLWSSRFTLNESAAAAASRSDNEVVKSRAQSAEILEGSAGAAAVRHSETDVETEKRRLTPGRTTLEDRPASLVDNTTSFVGGHYVATNNRLHGLVPQRHTSQSSKQTPDGRAAVSAETSSTRDRTKDQVLCIRRSKTTRDSHSTERPQGKHGRSLSTFDPLASSESRQELQRSVDNFRRPATVTVRAEVVGIGVLRRRSRTSDDVSRLSGYCNVPAITVDDVTKSRDDVGGIDKNGSTSADNLDDVFESAMATSGRGGEELDRRGKGGIDNQGRAATGPAGDDGEAGNDRKTTTKSFLKITVTGTKFDGDQPSDQYDHLNEKSKRSKCGELEDSTWKNGIMSSSLPNLKKYRDGNDVTTRTAWSSCVSDDDACGRQARGKIYRDQYDLLYVKTRYKKSDRIDDCAAWNGDAKLLEPGKKVDGEMKFRQPPPGAAAAADLSGEFSDDSMTVTSLDVSTTSTASGFVDGLRQRQQQLQSGSAFRSNLHVEFIDASDSASTSSTTSIKKGHDLNNDDEDDDDDDDEEEEDAEKELTETDSDGEEQFESTSSRWIPTADDSESSEPSVRLRRAGRKTVEFTSFSSVDSSSCGTATDELFKRFSTELTSDDDLNNDASTASRAKEAPATVSWTTLKYQDGWQSRADGGASKRDSGVFSDRSVMMSPRDESDSAAAAAAVEASQAKLADEAVKIVVETTSRGPSNRSGTKGSGGKQVKYRLDAYETRRRMILTEREEYTISVEKGRKTTEPEVKKTAAAAGSQPVAEERENSVTIHQYAEVISFFSDSTCSSLRSSRSLPTLPVGTWKWDDGAETRTSDGESTELLRRPVVHLSDVCACVETLPAKENVERFEFISWRPVTRRRRSVTSPRMTSSMSSTNRYFGSRYGVGDFPPTGRTYLTSGRSGGGSGLGDYRSSYTSSSSRRHDPLPMTNYWSPDASRWRYFPSCTCRCVHSDVTCGSCGGSTGTGASQFIVGSTSAGGNPQAVGINAFHEYVTGMVLGMFMAVLMSKFETPV